MHQSSGLFMVFIDEQNVHISFSHCKTSKCADWSIFFSVSVYVWMWESEPGCLNWVYIFIRWNLTMNLIWKVALAARTKRRQKQNTSLVLAAKRCEWTKGTKNGIKKKNWIKSLFGWFFYVVSVHRKTLYTSCVRVSVAVAIAMKHTNEATLFMLALTMQPHFLFSWSTTIRFDCK